jgi:hypothetical protein
MYAATIESTNKTVAVFAKFASKGSEETTKASDGKFLKMKLKEPDQWKKSSGKTHRKHQMAFVACKSMSSMLWKMMDRYRNEMAQSGDAKATAKEVRM